MASPSKEENVLKIILENSPMKEWRFRDIVSESGVTRAAANKWLKKYVRSCLLKQVKKSGSFPYFTAGEKNDVYLLQKRIYALNQIYASGLVRQLMLLENAKTVIIFGSMIKGDWYKDSDIDILIYGNAGGFNKSIYEHRLKRSIELHIFEDRKSVMDVRSGLIKNVLNGYVVKGSLNDIISGVS